MNVTNLLESAENGLKRHLQSKDWSSIGKADICHVLSTTLFFLQEITEQLATTEEQTNGTD